MNYHLQKVRNFIIIGQSHKIFFFFFFFFKKLLYHVASTDFHIHIKVEREVIRRQTALILQTGVKSIISNYRLCLNKVLKKHPWVFQEFHKCNLENTSLKLFWASLPKIKAQPFKLKLCGLRELTNIPAGYSSIWELFMNL